MSYNLNKEYEKIIIELAKKYDIEKVILFGSRARGNNRPDSDIDLALLGGDCSYFTADFNDEIGDDVGCDLTCLDHEFEMGLRSSINRDGIVLYEDKIDYGRRYQLFFEALNDFERFVELTKQYPEIDGFVLSEASKVFGVCFKQSWKLLKLVLESHGESFDKNVAPRVVIEVACRRGIIEDNLIWKDILATYNRGDNIKDDFVDVRTKYLKIFHDLKCRVDTMSVENR